MIGSVFYFSVSPEEERKVRANDREYNEKFQYAVRLSRHCKVERNSFMFLVVMF